MKPALKLFTSVLLMGVLVYVSCKKEKPCEGYVDGNKPPIANAGRDTILVLPVDSMKLDGSLSSDPDGTISSFLWTKLSGPPSFNITKASDSVTKVKALTVGTYLVELKVTDNGGLSARDTMKVIVVYVETPNHSPVTNAGADQTITWPTTWVTLDGTRSTDPDNNIATFLWTKLTGPSLFTIANANAVQTQVDNLQEGAYQFELRVTDSGGLFSRDTVLVTVNSIPVPPGCDNSDRPQINSQLIPFGTLSQARAGMAVASAGNKIVFAGGVADDYPDYWGSSRVDIYDIVTQQWSTTELSHGRWGIAAIASGSKIFFAGGEFGDGAFDSYYSNVDIYDATTNSWSVASLSEPRSLIAAAAVGNKVFFAGGEVDDVHGSNKVDIYDLSTNTWSTTLLSEPRRMISPVTVDNKIYFAGGFNQVQDNVSNRIDIYNNLTNSWSISSLNEPKRAFAAIAIDNKIYWAGGNTSGLTSSCSVEIKDVTTGTSAIDYLFMPGIWWIDFGNNAVIKDNKIVFLRTPFNTNSNNKFDIYDITTHVWSIGVLPVNIYLATIISVNNTIYIAGGSDITGGWFGVKSNQVWKLQF